jgi:hypothetical protein
MLVLMLRLECRARRLEGSVDEEQQPQESRCGGSLVPMQHVQRHRHRDEC